MDFKRIGSLSFIVGLIAFIVIMILSFETDFKIGEVIFFGEYEQDNDLSNGNEPIEWIVMEVNKSEAVLLSRYILDLQCFAYYYEDSVSWDKSFIREWLNRDFYKMAFTDEEKRLIRETECENTPNFISDIDGGEKTVDKIYLLSLEDMEKYGMAVNTPFPEEMSVQERYDDYVWNPEKYDYRQKRGDRLSYLTEYAYGKRLFIYSYISDPQEQNNPYEWALRSKGMEKSTIVGVSHKGYICDYYADREMYIGIRPVIKIDLSNGNVSQINTELKKKEHIPVSDNVRKIDPDNLNSFINLSNGDRVYFGRYEQDGFYSNGLEPIEWKVLCNSDSGILLMSRYMLDYMGFNDDLEDVSWEDCSLRKWMNDEFVNAAFNDEEKNVIKPVLLNGDGEITDSEKKDFVFIPSVEDITNENYGFLKNGNAYDINRACAATAYYRSKYSEENEILTVYEIRKRMGFCLTGAPWVETLTREGEISFDFLLRTRAEDHVYYSDDKEISVPTITEVHNYKCWPGTRVDNKSGIRPMLWLKK